MSVIAMGCPSCGGGLEVETTEGEGSVFRVLFPTDEDLEEEEA